MENNEAREAKKDLKLPVRAEVGKRAEHESRLSKYNSDDDDLSDSKWRLELAWLSKALEPALQLCRWALPTGWFLSVHGWLYQITAIRFWMN